MKQDQRVISDGFYYFTFDKKILSDMAKCLPFLFALFFCAARSQTPIDDKLVEVTYYKAFKKFDSESASPPKLMKGLEYQLLFDLNEAKFEYKSNMPTDANPMQKRLIGMGGGKGIFYKNILEEVHLRKNTADEKDYVVEKKFVIYDWDLKAESKNIMGFECFKAIGSYEEYNYFLEKKQTISVVAWYAPAIPVSFGPSGFDGLPGLVLESVRGSFYLIAQDIRFFGKDEKKISRPEGVLISDEDYAKMQYQNFMNLVGKN